MRILLFFFVFSVLSSCSRSSDQKVVDEERISITQDLVPDTTEALHMSGKALAQAYCQACHTLPDPGLLDKITWQKKVLPQMALRLGLSSSNLNPFLGKSTQEIYELLQAGIFPQKPYVSKANWKKIEDYYVENAPEKLKMPKVAAAKPDLKNFRIVVPALNKGKAALATMVKYLPNAKELWVGDMRNWIFRLDKQLQVVDSLVMDTPPVDMVKGSQNYKVLTIGSIIPSDKGEGRIEQIRKVLGGITYRQPLLDELRRPVNLEEADLNQDNIPDLIVCNYGYNLGSLVWYQGIGKGRYKLNLLKSLPGSRKVEVVDLNKDGLPDIVAMLAQGTETIKVFYNQSSGKFKEENLVQLPPVYGLSYFELADFNNDGALDIVLSNGDNADYSPILKPYHGIRIYLNDKNNKFSDTYFYPMPGATKAIARGFDQDGDLDIAAISYFPDFEAAPESGFLYLQQTNKMVFQATTFKQSQYGRWFTMDAGDYDQDGDIILGSFTNALTPAPAALQKQWIKEGPSIIVLQNTKNAKNQNVASADK